MSRQNNCSQIESCYCDVKSDAAGHRHFMRLGAKRKKMKMLIPMDALVGEIIHATAKRKRI